MSEDNKKTGNITANNLADYLRYGLGVNVVPARNKIPKVKWEGIQYEPVTEEEHTQWKADGVYNDGMQLIAGKDWHNDAKKNLYVNCIDLDNQRAITEFCTRKGVTITLEDFAKNGDILVEYYGNPPQRAHIVCYSTHPFPTTGSITNKKADKISSNDIPAIEITRTLFLSSSPRKDGHNYEIIGGLPNPDKLTEWDELELHIDEVFNRFGIPYLERKGRADGSNLTPIHELFKTETRILKGNNRHEGILREMDSILARNRAVVPLETMRKWAWDENLRLCEPPLDEIEFEKQWQCAIDWISSDIGMVNSTGYFFNGIIHFNNTKSDKLSYLNNSLGLYVETPEIKRTIWLVK